MTDPTPHPTPWQGGDSATEMTARIQAYLDGEGPQAERLAIERLLDASEEARAIETRLRRERAALRTLFDMAERDMAEAAAHSAPQARPEGARWRGGAFAIPGLALAAGLAIGFVIGAERALDTAPPTTSMAAAEPGWRLSAATYHRLYGAETFSTAPVAPEAALAGLATLGETLGLDLSGIAAPAGLRLERAQLLRIDGRLLGQIAFSTADGTAVSLCVVRRGEPGDVGGPSTDTLIDVAAVDWRSPRHAFLLLGAAGASDAEAASLLSLATRLRRTLDS